MVVGHQPGHLLKSQPIPVLHGDPLWREAWGLPVSRTYAGRVQAGWSLVSGVMTP